MSVYDVGSGMFKDAGHAHKHPWVEAGSLAQVPDRDFGSSKDFLLLRPGWVKETYRADFKLLTIEGSHYVNGHLLGPGRTESAQNVQYSDQWNPSCLSSAGSHRA